MKRGLVIGKFYPPHKGHSYLIESALSRTDELTVVVCELAGESIPGKLRADWIQEMHPGAKVILIKDELSKTLEGASPEEVSKKWAEYAKKILGYVPDAVFTSEEYGDRWAKFLGTNHILIDIDRKKYPVSGTRVRSNPLGFWDLIGEPVRAFFAKRVVVLGAESSGTTTLSKALARHYKTNWVPEFGRMYWEAKMYSSDPSWRSEEFGFIAAEQNRLEDKLARTCNKILICDTDSFATRLWHERYMGFMQSSLDEISKGRSPDLYILTDVDIPFVQDGTRDGEAIRENMHLRFKEELEKKKANYIILSGSQEKRLKEAIAACDALLLPKN